MASVAEMTSDLEWRDMQSKMWMVSVGFLGAITLAIATLAIAQEETQELPSDSPIPEVQSSDASPRSTARAEADGADPTSDESPATDTDDYIPTERISEDRSISFPVDI